MDILFVSRESFPVGNEGQAGGIGRYIEMVSRGLVGIGVNVTVFSQSNSQELCEKNVDGVKIVYLPKWEKTISRYWRLKEFLDLFAKTKIASNLWADVSPKWHRAKMVAKYIPLIENQRGIPFSLVEFADCGAEGFFYLRPKLHLPVVTRVHTPTQALNELNKVPKRIGHKILIHLERTMTQRSDAVTAPSKSAAELAVKDWMLTASVPTYIPNPIDTQKFSPDIKGSASRFIIFYSGRIEWLKGMRVIPEIVQGLKEKGIDFEIRMAGRDTKTAPGSSSMVAWLKKSIPPADQSRVIFLGHLGDKQLIRELQAASIGLYLSLFETFGYTCLEAQACGIPVIASRYGGMGEIVVDGVTGILVDPSDIKSIVNAIDGFVKQPELVDKFGLAARNAAVANYSLPVVCRKMLSFYEHICRRKHHGD